MTFGTIDEPVAVNLNLLTDSQEIVLHLDYITVEPGVKFGPDVNLGDMKSYMHDYFQKLTVENLSCYLFDITEISDTELEDDVVLSTLNKR